jgi:translation initiation factor 1A
VGVFNYIPDLISELNKFEYYYGFTRRFIKKRYQFILIMKKPYKPAEPGVLRVRIPKGKEILGIVLKRLGGSRMTVQCLDGKERICRIPGRLRRALWVREQNIVIVEPWELGGDKKGDIIYKYRSAAEVGFLKRNGYLKNIEDEF